MLRSDPDALRKLRRSRGHSTRTLAAVAQLSHSAIVRLESGPVAVLPDTAWKIARTLGIDVSEFTTVEHETPEAIS